MSKQVSVCVDYVVSVGPRPTSCNDHSDLSWIFIARPNRVLNNNKAEVSDR